MMPLLLFRMSSGAAVVVPAPATSDLEIGRQRRSIKIDGERRELRIGEQRRRLHVRGR